MNLLIKCTSITQVNAVMRALRVGLGYSRRFPDEFIPTSASLVVIRPEQKDYHVYSVLLRRPDRRRVTYEEMLA